MNIQVGNCQIFSVDGMIIYIYIDIYIQDFIKEVLQLIENSSCWTQKQHENQ